MNDFEAELLELIMEIIREDKNQNENFLRRDLDIIIRKHMAMHDAGVRRETRSMLDEDEIYDEGFEDGYTIGWNDAKEEICEAINELRISR